MKSILSCFILFVGFIAISLVQGCKNREDDIVIATVSNDWFNAPVIMAEQSVKLENKRFKTFDQRSGLASKNAILSKNAQIGLASPVVLLRDPKCWKDIVVLGVYMQSHSVIGVVTKGDSIEDLPEPFGIVRGTISEVYYKGLMSKLGLTAPALEQKLLDVSPPDIAIHLRNGTIGSGFIWEPHLSRAGKLDNVTVFLSDDIYTVNVALIASREALISDPDGIYFFVQKVKDACEQITENPNEAAMKIVSLVGIESELLEKSWHTVDFRFENDRTRLKEIFSTEIEALKIANMMPQENSSIIYDMLNLNQ